MTGGGLLPPLAVTMGEPAGVGAELTLMAWRRRGADSLPSFYLLDDPGRVSALSRKLDLGVPVRTVESPAEAAECFSTVLPVLPHPPDAEVTPGRPDPANAAAVISAVDRAVAAAQTGEAAGVVTNPVHKRTLYAAGFRDAGHTEYLGRLAGVSRPVMMLVCAQLRVVPVTMHLALRDAVNSLRREDIVAAAKICARALTDDFGVEGPRLTVAGLNPHAGEGGSMGDEELRIIAPAIDDLRAAGIRISGPHSPDSLFHDEARKQYDAAICMVHDHALIPLKTLGFDDGVNVTLGLPFVRTSPDHGTALDLAATGRARPDSLIAAIAAAGSIAARRASTVPDTFVA
jgi:4-hydroxythreonine-4-phosphate dehydrogenase